MTVTLDFPPNVETYIIQEAQREKTSVSDYITRRVSETVSVESVEEEKRQRSLRLLDSLLEIGDEEEQRETFEYLKQAMDEDRLSDRKRFK